jgi:hypothetical protein
MKHSTRLLLALSVCFAVMPLAACSTSDVLDATSADTTLTFEISGASTASTITYVTDNFGISQAADVSLPWTKSVTYTKGTTGVNISAQNAGGGDISCAIKEGSKVLASNTSSGQYSIVSCAVS